jgi:hypothetical protein
LSDVIEFKEGGFAYLRGRALPFSNGVIALNGHVFTRVRLRNIHPLAEGLEITAEWIKSQNRPLASLAACELRSPAPMSRSNFVAFNDHYISLLRSNGFAANGAFPIARSNMALQFKPPSSNTLFAFTYATPFVPAVETSSRDFLISGKPETAEDPPSIIAMGDVSPAGLIAKSTYVIQELRRRVDLLGGRWKDITGAQIYTVHSLNPVLDGLRSNGLTSVGLTLFPGYPPIIGLDFEIDVRSVSFEQVI